MRRFFEQGSKGRAEKRETIRNHVSVHFTRPETLCFSNPLDTYADDWVTLHLVV